MNLVFIVHWLAFPIYVGTNYLSKQITEIFDIVTIIVTYFFSNLISAVIRSLEKYVEPRVAHNGSLEGNIVGSNPNGVLVYPEFQNIKPKDAQNVCSSFMILFCHSFLAILFLLTFS